MHKKTGRHELKHSINEADMYQIRSKLKYIAALDQHASDGNGYRVRSLYFDNVYDKALREKIDGINGREKFRIRLYDGDADFIRLEKKSKINGLCYKENAKITKEQCERLISGDVQVLIDNGSMLCLELYAKMKMQLLKPRNIVEYKREAYVYKAGNVRVTLDYDIRTSDTIHAFLDEKILMAPISGAAVLEVKYDNYLPEIIRGMVSLPSRHATAFSKYAATRLGAQ